MSKLWDTSKLDPNLTAKDHFESTVFYLQAVIGCKEVVISWWGSLEAGRLDNPLQAGV